ncbi:MAG: hypothetical protein AB7I79_12170 [Rhizobiaceae bacterium]
MTTLARLILAGGLAAAAGPAAASEAEFLQSLDGSWNGTGSVKVRTNSSPIKVNCTFQSDATDTALSLDGNCRGLLIVSRAIGADLRADGARYAGSYVGAGTGTAGLNGSRSGNAINLDVRWAKEVNGDRLARLTVQKIGDDGMRLTTVDVDPDTGKNVVTSEINLRRS